MSSEDIPIAKLTSNPKTMDHPKYSVMIQAAVKSLKDRKGSSKQAIMKYIVANYNLGSNEEKKAIQYVNMSLRESVKNGKLIQTTGTGASGRFKLPVPEKGTAAEMPKPDSSPKKSKSSAAAKEPKSTKKSKSPSPEAKYPTAQPPNPSKPETLDHPKYSVMIQSAVKALKDRKGASKQSIVKYIMSNYNLGDTEEKMVTQYIRMSLRGSVKNGSLIQTRGTGASGRFKVPVAEKGAASQKPKPASSLTKSKSSLKKEPKSHNKSKSPSPKSMSPEVQSPKVVMLRNPRLTLMATLSLQRKVLSRASSRK